ncbi:MAG: phytanoyl-CoA dioxygenase family protein [Candidatus Accumulibacter sp.]|uniref:phytanoyl-CoA dioxygenase family protein n=1 Tax=Accumulibacter sp. TaxID=2053492 RepID=UPI001A560E52|nr:phytanoyl-CoA dioxygenase family protein [Accumulibacter sp.]MBL8394755.1 phytanoyl-CoA dioxygenase family protein [Accumulibacter sp.]
MKPIDLLKAPLHLLSLASRAKSFADNPIIGSPRFNRWGLHRYRIALADRMAWSRRCRLARQLSADDVQAYARDGLIIKRDFLPSEVFGRVRDEAHAHLAEAREMRQGRTVTRRVTLDPVDARQLPHCVVAANDPRLAHLMRYVASHDVTPLMYLQIIIVDPERGAQDPQTALHLDTFHSIAKAWLFLQDVGEDDGPLAYVPGSHRLDDKRLAWEYQQSLTAASARNVYHARGSFRAGKDDLDRLGLGPAVRLAVPANTLVVADTHGFHARTPSPRPTLRMEIYGTLRWNPYAPDWGPDPLGWPGIVSRRASLLDQAADMAARLGLTGNSWPKVAARRMDSPQVGSPSR